MTSSSITLAVQVTRAVRREGGGREREREREREGGGGER